MGIIGVSQGLSDAQSKALSPLESVGTDIIVTRTVAPTPVDRDDHDDGAQRHRRRLPRRRGARWRGRGRFFAGGPGGSLNSSDAAALAAANSSVITDLAKLGPAGTKFTHDFFVPGTLITFPSEAVSTVAKVKGVT